MAHTFEDLRELATKELDEIVKKGEFDENSLVCTYKLVDIIKDINEIEMADSGYSQANRMVYPYYPYAMSGDNSYNNSYNNSYRGGNSYNDGYSSRVRRDSMGRYSPNGYNGGNSYRGYSRDGEREQIMEKMERMMNEAGSETERQAIQRIMNQM